MSRGLGDVYKRQVLRHWKATEFNLSMPRQDIANYLGLAVETVSRLFAQFQERKIIEVDRRRINILKMDKLRSIVGECDDPCVSKAQQG